MAWRTAQAWSEGRERERNRRFIKTSTHSGGASLSREAGYGMRTSRRFPTPSWPGLSRPSTPARCGVVAKSQKCLSRRGLARRRLFAKPPSQKGYGISQDGAKLARNYIESLDVSAWMAGTSPARTAPWRCVTPLPREAGEVRRGPFRAFNFRDATV